MSAPELDRGVARRQAFLKAARAVFLEHGYEAASVNEIVRRAGGSLATLYAQYGNKEGMFLAVAEDQHERFVAEIMPQGVDDLPLAEGLQLMGEQLLAALLTEDNLAFYRIVVGEGRKFPQLLQRYLTQGASHVLGHVANYMRARAQQDGGTIAEVDIAAGYFFELVRSRHHYFALADSSHRPTKQEIAEHVRHVVRFFLNGALAR